MIVISLDISKSSTGYSIIHDGSTHVKLFVTVRQDTQPEHVIHAPNMIQTILQRLKTDITRAHVQFNERVAVVVEGYTDTINHNDRLGTANHVNSWINQIGKLVESLVSYKVRNHGYKPEDYELTVNQITPWAWRRFYSLSTRVYTDINDHRINTLTYLLGHDILKQESIDYVISNVGDFNIYNSDNIEINDDIAESVMIGHAFIKNGCVRFDKTENHNPRKLDKLDVINFANTIFA